MRSSIFRSIQLLIKFNKLYLPLSIIYKVLQGIIPMASVICMQQIINEVQSKNSFFESILKVIFFYICLQIINNIFQQLYEKYKHKFSVDFSKAINIQVMDKAIALSLKDYEDKETYNLISRAQNQSGTNLISYINSIFDITQQIISIIGMGYILFSYKWQIVLLIIIIPIIRTIATYIFDKKLYKIRIKRTSDNRQKWYINFLLTTGNAFKEIKIFGLGNYLISKYENLQNRIINEEMNIYNKNMLVDMLLDFLEWVILGGIYIYIFYEGFIKIILIGDVTAYFECINNIKSSINGIFIEINNLVDQSMYINLFFEFLDIPESPHTGIKEIKLIEQIEFENVSYKYKNGNYAIKNASFIITPRTTIALIGENGSGKTTLLKLILGLYDDYEGNIYINNINIREINITQYQRKIGIVFQDYMKYETTIRENITYGNLKQLKNDAEIIKLIRKVHLENKVNNTKGIDTVIGNWFGEQQFSIGEWQRIVIARALIKDADMYIFDEPDSSLDIFRQKEIVELIKQVTQNKIGLYVSHKISLANEIANIIMVLEDGMITEIGSHKELIANKQKYSQLYKEALKQEKVN